MRIHYCVADFHGPGFFRCLLPQRYLQDRGHEVTVSTVLPTIEQASTLDVLIAQRVCDEVTVARWKKIAEADVCKLVMELDDDLWNIDRSNKASVHVFDHHRLRQLSMATETADLVTVSTDPLATTVSRYNDHVTVLPNSLPDWLISHETVLADKVMGWAGSNTHLRDFGEAAKPVSRFLSMNQDWSFMTVSPVNDYSERVKTPRTAARVHYTPWVEGVENYLRQLNFSIGLAPLHPSGFNDAKSDLKVLELCGLGIPAIVTNTGPYARAIADGAPVIGMDVNKHKKWLEAMNSLAHDDVLRAQTSKAQREWASHKTIGKRGHLWESAYSALMADDLAQFTR